MKVRRLTFVLSRPLHSSLPGHLLLKRKVRKSSLKSIDRGVLAGLKYKAATLLLKHRGCAFLSTVALSQARGNYDGAFGTNDGRGSHSYLPVGDFLL
jgi:hypothetical protein